MIGIAGTGRPRYRVLDSDVVLSTAECRQEVQSYRGEPDAAPPERLDEPQWHEVREFGDRTLLAGDLNARTNAKT